MGLSRTQFDLMTSLEAAGSRTPTQRELAAAFRVMSIPTAMLFENGQVKETLVGVQPKARLEAMTK